MKSPIENVGPELEVRKASAAAELWQTQQQQQLSLQQQQQQQQPGLSRQESSNVPDMRPITPNYTQTRMGLEHLESKQKEVQKSREAPNFGMLEVR